MTLCGERSSKEGIRVKWGHREQGQGTGLGEKEKPETSLSLTYSEEAAISHRDHFKIRTWEDTLSEIICTKK